MIDCAFVTGDRNTRDADASATFDPVEELLANCLEAEDTHAALDAASAS